MTSRALVVFSGRADMPWQRLLRPGFRHCSLILDDGEHWLLVEPLSNYLQVRTLGLAEQPLARRLRNAGLLVVETAPIAQRNRPAPMGLWTCVETVKRGLCIHALIVQTPWQLFTYLENNKKKNLDCRTE